MSLGGRNGPGNGSREKNNSSEMRISVSLLLTQLESLYLILTGQVHSIPDSLSQCQLVPAQWVPGSVCLQGS